MRIFPEQLAAALTKGWSERYLLFGDDLFLKQEARQAILHAAKQHNFAEVHRFEIDARTDWQPIYDCCQSLSLFATRQLLILTLPQTATAGTLNAPIKELITHLHSDVALIVEGPKLSYQQEAAPWCNALKKSAVWVTCNTPQGKQFLSFIHQRCSKLGLFAEAPAVQLLAQWHEGNLMALDQSLLQLQLLYPDAKLTLARLESVLTSHSQYTPFQLIEAIFAGKPKRSSRILQQLQDEQVEPTLLLRLLQKELRQLYQLQESLHSGVPLRQAFDHFKIWQNRRPHYQAALQQLPLALIAKQLHALCQLEIAIKTEYSEAPWPALHFFCLSLSDKLRQKTLT
ncbi:MAG: DNA polymerase III subunit delta [Vibrionaceae bacterium]